MLTKFFKIKSPYLEKYFKNTGWLFADNFLKQIVNVGVGIFLARYLKPEGLGTINYASTFMQLLMPFALLGINAIAIKEMVNKDDQINKLIGTSFILKLFSSALALMLLVISVLFFEHDKQNQLFILIIGLSYLLYPLQVIDFYFQSKLISKYTVISQQIATFVAAALKITGIILGYKIEFFIWLILVEIIISSFLQVFFYRKYAKGVGKWSFNTLLAKSILKQSFPIIFTGFFIILYMRVDQILIQKLLNVRALGNFTAATKLSEAFYVIPGILAGALFPAIINGLKISRYEFFNRMQRLYRLLSLLSISATLFVIIFADILVNILYGPLYMETASVLRIHFINAIFVCFGVAYSQAFIVEDLQRFTTINTVIGAFLNICLNLILIPILGILGSAIATLVAQFYSGFFCLYLNNKTRKHFFMMLQSLNVIATIKLYSLKYYEPKN